MKYIETLREGEMVKEIYLCKQYAQLKTKVGKTYYSLNLQDKTGTLDAKVWDVGPGIDHFEVMDYIQVEGQLTSFQGSLQLNIKRIRRAKEGEYDPVDFMPSSDRDLNEMYNELLTFVGKVKEPHLLGLLKSFFIDDKKFVADFKRHSAAKNVHHGFIGGLLEHTVSVASLCDYFADHYPLLNKDLLLSAALFHDIGKLGEISDFPENDYTDEGNLIGHLVSGAEMIGLRIREMDGFPKALALELKHCILAHHGELAYGSPKKPAIAEAMALNFADNLDAKMQTMKEMFASADEKLEWIGYQRLFESNIRRTTI